MQILAQLKYNAELADVLIEKVHLDSERP